MLQPHLNLTRTLAAQEDSPSRQRVESWLREGGAQLSPRAYRARALAELSRSTTVLERQRAPPRPDSTLLGGAEVFNGALLPRSLYQSTSGTHLKVPSGDLAAWQCHPPGRAASLVFSSETSW